MPSAVVKEWEVNGTPCLMVVATRSLAENEEISLDLGYQLEVCMYDLFTANLENIPKLNLFCREKWRESIEIMNLTFIFFMHYTVKLIKIHREKR